MKRIGIIAIGENNKLYSIGYITISDKGDVYYINKVCGSDMHISRHVSGDTHYKSRQNNFQRQIRKVIKIEEFKGLEFLGTTGFGLYSLPGLYKECTKMKKCDGIFAIDMRTYKNSAFNMSIAIITEEGLQKLYEHWKRKNKRQIYLFTDSRPMIAIYIFDAKKLGSE